MLFERLSLEIFQAGLSWLLILNRREALRKAFAGFVPERVAAFGAAERERLLTDPALIRNRRKVDAVIHNACRVLALRATHGSFASWIEQPPTPPSLEAWVRVFRGTFRFAGTEVVKEFLMSIGHLPGAHHERCPVYTEILEHHPRWMRE
ncbi:MAG: tagA [Rhodospirillaceae bacterium]|nr:MAG: tagA [Rhodospirillaceae bacterium]